MALTIAIGGKISKIRICFKVSTFLANCLFWEFIKVGFDCPNFVYMEQQISKKNGKLPKYRERNLVILKFMNLLIFSAKVIKLHFLRIQEFTNA
jgi:hypothetical protein